MHSPNGKWWAPKIWLATVRGTSAPVTVSGTRMLELKSGFAIIAVIILCPVAKT
jgi:hypothetical protein